MPQSDDIAVLRQPVSVQPTPDRTILYHPTPDLIATNRPGPVRATPDRAASERATSDRATSDLARPDPALPEPGGPEQDLAALSAQLDQLDHELLALVQRRTAVARQLPAARAAADRPSFHHAADLTVTRRFADLGQYGADLGLLLIRLAK